MASFFRSTFDNFVNNINATLNQHSNQATRSSGGGSTTQQSQTQAQARTRASNDRPTAEATNTSSNQTGQRTFRTRNNYQPRFCGLQQEARRQQSQHRTSAAHSSRTNPNSQHPHNQYHPFNTRHSSNVTSGSGDADIGNSNMSTTANQHAKTEKQLDVSDIRDPQDISQLSVKQLKIILTKNCIDYKGIFEKETLREKVMQLWIDCNERKASSRTNHPCGAHDLSDDIDESQACKICMDKEINCVLLECGHMISCVTCGRKLAECPICRQNVTRCVRTFKG